jgi:hypothetical protein
MESQVNAGGSQTSAGGSQDGAGGSQTDADAYFLTVCPDLTLK